MAMTGQDVVNDLRASVLEPHPTFFSQTRMLYLINLAQNEYVRRTRCLQSSAFTSTIQGQAAYPMPCDWLGSEKVFYKSVSGGQEVWYPLYPTNIEKMSQESPNFLSADPNTFSNPQKHWIINHTLYLYPKPRTSGASDLFVFYESSANQLTSLDDTLSVDDSLYPGIRAYILMELWRQDNEDAKADKYEAVFEKNVGLGFKWKNKRILDGRWALDIQSFMPYSYGGGGLPMTNLPTNPLNM